MEMTIEDTIKEALLMTNILKKNHLLYKNMIYALIDDLKERSNSNIVTPIGSGHCTYGIRVGDYALAIGAIDEYEIEPNVIFSNAILCRKTYKEEDFKIIVSLYLERPQEENDTINIYNKIRTTHQRWYDADFDNFGIVPENFTHPFSNVSKEGLKMLGIDNCFIEHLEKGDQRLIDHGYILPEEIEPVFIFDFKKINGLEDHYQKAKCLQKKY